MGLKAPRRLTWSMLRRKTKSNADEEISATSKNDLLGLESSISLVTCRTSKTWTSEDNDDDEMSLITAASTKQPSNSLRSSSSCSLGKIFDEEDDSHDDDHHHAHPTQKHVHFGVAQVREYPQVLGDHPYCSLGCPLELGWKSRKSHEFTVEEYESHQRYSHHTSMSALKLTPEERRAILDVNETVSDSEIRRACRRRNRSQNEACLGQRRLQKEFFVCPHSTPPSCQ